MVEAVLSSSLKTLIPVYSSYYSNIMEVAKEWKNDGA